jgi:acyl carrier protein
MEITKLTIRDCIIEAIQQVLSGDTPVNDQINPIADLGLQSIDGICVAANIEERLRFAIPNQFNPFIDDGPPRRARSIGEIVDCVYDIAVRQKE